MFNKKIEKRIFEKIQIHGLFFGENYRILGKISKFEPELGPI